MTDNAALVCEYRACDVALPEYVGVGRKRKFCSKRCNRSEYKARRLDRGKVPRSELFTDKPIRKTGNAPRDYVPEDGRGSPRRGPKYDQFRALGLAEKVHRGELSVVEAAEEFGTGHASVSRWMAAYTEDLALTQRQAAWQQERSTDLTQLDPAGFKRFRDRYFRTPNTDAISPDLAGKPYITKPFHLRWFDALMGAIHGGRRLVILSPPRSNKSEILIHAVIYLVVHNPNLRVLWVGYNEAIAKQTVELIRQELESNEGLIADFAGPSGTFAPASRSAEPWSNDRITLAGRTIKSKSATVTALGRGGGTLSRDCDLIVVDDIVDHKTVASTAQREADERWFKTNLMSRKMRHTGLVVIGSRQHHDDIYRHMLESDAYSQIVERSIRVEELDDPADLGARNDAACLFPEIAPYSFLMDQKAAIGAPLFDMMYQNLPRSGGMQHFTPEMIVACKNRTRRLGDLDYEPTPGMHLRSLRLVAGLDPAVSGYQAAFLWAVDLGSKTRFMVDMRNEQAGGLPGFKRVVEDWLNVYGCLWWVVETKNTQAAYLQWPEFQDFAARNGIRVDTHSTTAQSKYDPQYGVSAMPRLMEQASPLPGATQMIDLPYADAEARAATDSYARQCLDFTGERAGKSRLNRSDILMASWFPEAYFRGYRGGEARERVKVSYREGWFPTSPMGRPL